MALGPLRLILMQSGPIWEVKIAIIFHLFFCDKELQLVKIIADLGVNVILVFTLAKHCSYIYNLDSYRFKIGTLNSPKGGQKFSRGGGGGEYPAPPKRNPAEVTELAVYSLQK